MLPESFLCDPCERHSNHRIGCSIDGEMSTERKREWYTQSRHDSRALALPGKRKASELEGSEIEMDRITKPKKRVRIEEDDGKEAISKEAADLLVATFEKLFEHWNDKKSGANRNKNSYSRKV
jgi:hypothetical protein